MKKVTQMDRSFTELPRNLQEIILDLLPIRDAVRTSILSRKWRESWKIIPSLIFDREFFMSIRLKLDRYRDPKLKTHEFLSVINNILLLHNGPLLKFSLGFPEHFDAPMIGDQIKRWIPLLSSKHLKQLTLQIFVSTFSDHYYFDPNTFSCLELTHLKLRCVCLTEFGTFSYLTNLKLVNCHGPMFRKSMFQCPMLERLTLKGCANLYHTNFCAPKLECLHINSLKIPLEGLEMIIELTFCVRVVGSSPHNVATFIGCLHKVETLTLGFCSLEHLAAAGEPDRDPKPLPYLKNLHIYYVDFTDLSEVSCMLYIIQKAPHLCNLEVESGVINLRHRGDVKNYQIDESQKYNLNNLEYVTFSHVQGFKTEIEVIKFVVEHSPMLKEIFIYTRVQHMELDSFIQEVEGSAIASPVAKICFECELCDSP